MGVSSISDRHNFLFHFSVWHDFYMPVIFQYLKRIVRYKCKQEKQQV